ncbi:MAG: WD40-repeat-containing domain protein [Benjaminiella poitrasii]|nr:MAG: WD40-repeat-containing domain protein [Benjaminiella poitrasii]
MFEEEEGDYHSIISTIVPEISISPPPPPQEKQYKLNSGKYIKIKSKHKRYQSEFSKLLLAQIIPTSYYKHDMASSSGNDTNHRSYTPDASHATEPGPNYPYGAIWVLKFSKDGRYLASAGQNCVIYLWRVLDTPSEDAHATASSIHVLDDTPFMEYTGHEADILDLAWSKNNFLLSSSMDCTVRLWHTTQSECLCVFKHLNFVTSVDFHPKDDRYFLSGSMEGKVRIWSIPEKRVAFWNEIPNNRYPTAVGFTLDGKTVVAGSQDGYCYFFETQNLKYITQVDISSHGGHHRRLTKKGPKITGIEAMPGMSSGDEKILVSSNDSKVRLFNLKDKSLTFKYKGLENTSLQIKASFSDDGSYIISGSEDCHAYIWRTEQASAISSLSPRHESILPVLDHLQTDTLSNDKLTTSSPQQQTRISKWLAKRREKKQQMNYLNDDSKLRNRTEYFEAHDHVVTAAIFAPTKTRQHVAKTKQDMIYSHTPANNNNDSSSSSSSSNKSISSNSRHEQEEMGSSEAHIIITADFRGIIKVWRVDSGCYEPMIDTSESTSLSGSLQILSSSQSSATGGSNKSPVSSPKTRRNFNLFHTSRQ